MCFNLEAIQAGELEALITHEGERYLPNPRTYQAAMHLGHMASYREALRYSYGRRVLDLGCGTGYGAFFLASYGAAQVTAVDISAVTLAYARTVYTHPVLRYLQAEAAHLTFADRTFDFVFSSQVIEHVHDAEAFLREIRRLLAPGGFCLLTTPNQRLFSPQGVSRNPHHLNEMSWDSYRQLAQQVFSTTRFRGIPQHCLKFSEGMTEPRVKPNREIRLQDYQVRDDDLDKCENMLCFGHRDPGALFTPTLPSELKPVADELAPLFWDTALRRWVALGLTFEEGASPPATLADRHRLTQRFHSPYPGLYRVEFELAAAAPQPLHVGLARQGVDGSSEVVHAEVLAPAQRMVEIVFDPQSDSQDQAYMLSVTPAKTWRSWLWRKPVQVVMVRGQAQQANALLGDTPLAVQLALRTFHCYLPPPCTEKRRLSLW